MDPEPTDTEAGRFDRAVAYFNAGRYFEAHEDWEELWLEAEGAHRLWLQGLIQYAAAFVHYSRGFFPRGYTVLMRQATEKVTDYAGRTHHIRWPELQADLAPWIAHGERVAGDADLVADAPPEVPRIGYEEGYTPQPLPLDPVEE